jgi:hypothetical protein
MLALSMLCTAVLCCRWGASPPDPSKFSPNTGTSAPVIEPWITSFVPGTCPTGFCPSDVITNDMVVSRSWSCGSAGVCGAGLLKMAPCCDVLDSLTVLPGPNTGSRHRSFRPRQGHY